MADLTDAEKRALLVERVLEVPEYLPIAWSTTPAMLDTEPAVVAVLRTPAYTVRPVFRRDGALAFAAELRRTATRGPGLMVPDGAGEISVPGR